MNHRYLHTLFSVKRHERPAMLAMTLLLAAFQTLCIAKFLPLFADYSEEHWRVFMRNFHMSGFDPITYKVLTDWHPGYDLLRHPLLAVMMYPLYLVNRGLWWITGCNCCQFVAGAVLLFCSSYSWLWLYRILYALLGLRRRYALLLSVYFFGFAYILLSTFIPDHFGISLYLLLLTLYVAGRRMRYGRTFSPRETALICMVVGGVTLSNGVAAFLIILVANGRTHALTGLGDVWARRSLWLPHAAAFLGSMVLLVAIALTVSSLTDFSQVSVADPVAQQMSWVRRHVPRMGVAVENFFGESLQLHRRHILGDVLTGRPVIVTYTWPVQYAVEAVMLLMLAAGAWLGRREPLLWACMGVLAMNVSLHLLLGFAIDEVYIMTAHWAFCMPVATAFLLQKDRQRHMRWSLAVVLAVITVYLWSYHGVLLYRYLTWPVRA